VLRECRFQYWDYCSWHATDIVRVEIAPRTVFLAVVESWKGELQPGSLYSVSRTEAYPWRHADFSYPKEEQLLAPDGEWN